MASLSGKPNTRRVYEEIQVYLAWMKSAPPKLAKCPIKKLKYKLRNYRKDWDRKPFESEERAEVFLACLGETSDAPLERANEIMYGYFVDVPRRKTPPPVKFKERQRESTERPVSWKVKHKCIPKDAGLFVLLSEAWKDFLKTLSR